MIQEQADIAAAAAAAAILNSETNCNGNSIMANSPSSKVKETRKKRKALVAVFVSFTTLLFMLAWQILSNLLAPSSDEKKMKIHFHIYNFDRGSGKNETNT